MRELRIRIERLWPKKEYTVGVLYVGGQRFCETLENAVRERKIPGITAIPAGCYEVDMNTISPKFGQRSWGRLYGGIVPWIRNVPDFERILIHPGNSAPADTSGCILVGRNREVGRLVDSQATYRRLMDEYLMPARDAGRKIVVEIVPKLP